jgi:hypothetical protein
LIELLEKVTARTLSLSPDHIIDEQLENELNQLSEKVKNHKGTGIGNQKQQEAELAIITGLYGVASGNADLQR